MSSLFFYHRLGRLDCIGRVCTYIIIVIVNRKNCFKRNALITNSDRSRFEIHLETPTLDPVETTLLGIKLQIRWLNSLGSLSMRVKFHILYHFGSRVGDAVK